MPRDPNQRAYLTVLMALGEIEQTDPLPPAKDPERVERGNKARVEGWQAPSGTAQPRSAERDRSSSRARSLVGRVRISACRLRASR